MSKHKRSGKKHTPKNIADVTINDFANSTVCKNRLKKASSSVTKVLKELEVEKAWDEKEDEFEGDLVAVEDEDGTVSYVIRKQETRRRRKTYSNNEDKPQDANGNEYPLDIWYLISEYIRPEDVGTFAAICKASYEVVCGAKFWFSLYKRYYTSVSGMPERLQPECLFRKYCLRASVVRALHYMYPPFVERLKSLTTFETHPDILRKRQCILLWSQMENKQWVYYFKMKEDCGVSPREYRRSEASKPDLLEMLDDVSANPDNSCRILQVTCKDFIPVPPVLGLTLTSVSLNLSQGFRHHRLQLWFGSGINAGTSTTDGGSCVSVILDPVINVKVLNWWHPLYPHSSGVEFLLNQE